MAARYKLSAAPKAKAYLQEWRETKFATQQDLSDRIGLAAATISRYETGERDWGKGYLEALAYAVGCRVGDLFSPPEKSPEEKLRAAMLSYGVDGVDLDAALKAIKGFVSDSAELQQSDQLRDQSGSANPPHERAP